ncbi:MAG TPA: CocE/NonD family hydrolase, partial [Acidobacteriaceae bacterium]
FVMNRPAIADGAAQTTSREIDETTDAYDTVDWLVKNVAGNNGRVGIYGISYDGFLAAMAGIGPHPAVKAISPQAPMTDVWMGDDFFHNGAFRQTYGYDYVQQMEAQKTDVRVEAREDTYDFFLAHTNFADAAQAAKMENLPTARVFLTQPAYTPFWQRMAVERHLTRVAVPTLLVGGYWDEEDMWGTQAEYAALAPHDPDHQLFLVLGPWYHGSWLGDGRAIHTNWGTLDAGQRTADEFRRNIEAPFFEKYLKDRPGFALNSVASFRTGANRWEFYGAWPPAESFSAARVYLEPGRRLSFDPPATARAPQGGVAASYVSDPADPVPYRHRPIQSTYGRGSQWFTWLAEDQRFATARNDVAAFTLPPLDHDVTITGDVMADLFASTTGSDADWVVKLIDAYPQGAPAPDSGYQLMVASEIFRGRYLHSFEQPAPLTPGEIDEYKWSLHGVDHTFLKGHSIMVVVQSTWFPLYDRNPQTYVPNIMTAPKDAYQPQTMTIYGSAEHPSHLEIELAK